MRDNAHFAFDLYGRLAQMPENNLFYSPYSISVALAMAYVGAAGTTAQQMSQVLHFDLPPGRLHTAFDALDLALASRAQDAQGQGLQLRIADSLWGDRSMVFRPAFLDTLAVNYAAGVRVVDFIGAYDSARLAINQWVSDRTNQKIPELLASGSIDSFTRFVLVNAIYFYAPWAVPFDMKVTAPANFTRADGSTVPVDTMTTTSSNLLGYAEGPTWQAVSLPYAGESTSLVLLVPLPGQFSSVEQGLSGDFLNSVFDSLNSDVTLDLALPKFTIHGATIDLTTQLQALGMVDAFTDGADFSPMAEQSVKLKSVFHQAFVRIDENGTEAAASTAVVGVPTSAPVLKKTVKADHPFFFFVRDDQTGAVIFVGRLTDPTTT